MSKIQGYVLENGTLIGPRHVIIECEDPKAMIETPIFTVLLKHPDGYVLFDAACHDDEKRQSPFILGALHMKKEERLLNRLAEINVAPEDIKYLVLSHMHADHSGYIEEFPNAEIYVSKKEFTNTVKEYALGISKVGPDAEFWIKSKLNWKLVPNQDEKLKLLDGITILNFGSGHSFGMLGLLVELENSGKILMVGDAIYTKENLGPPVKLPGMIQDKEAYLETIAYIVELAKKENAEIWFGHDFEQYQSLVKSTKGFYE